MHTFPAKARTATDGTLSLAIPTGFPDADVDVLVVVDVAPRIAPEGGAKPARLGHSWPAGYFEKYFGALRGGDVIRHPQGMRGKETLEERDHLN
jgi:hypothetical protein